VDSIALYLVYLAGAAASGAWVYLDAKERERANPGLWGWGSAVLFPIGVLFYVLSR
jgi:hypothetical protein